MTNAEIAAKIDSYIALLAEVAQAQNNPHQLRAYDTLKMVGPHQAGVDHKTVADSAVQVIAVAEEIAHAEALRLLPHARELDSLDARIVRLRAAIGMDGRSSVLAGEFWSVVDTLNNKFWAHMLDDGIGDLPGIRIARTVVRCA